MAKVKKKRKGSKVYKALANEVRESCKSLHDAIKERELAHDH